MFYEQFQCREYMQPTVLFQIYLASTSVHAYLLPPYCPASTEEHLSHESIIITTDKSRINKNY